MATGLSLHIGLNTIDRNKYEGEYQPLRNAENDAHFYYTLAKLKNFDAIKLSGEDATSENLLKYLNEYSNRLATGDMCFITYSGHGTRVTDLNNDEEDGYDEALVLYDRLFIDDEFQLCWAKFKPGVKLFFVNDSCCNGTVTRVSPHWDDSAEISPRPILRGIDRYQSAIDFEKNISYFQNIKSNSVAQKPVCSIIHIGACQDDQFADDGSVTEINGKFTTTVKELLEINSDYTYKSFYEKLKLQMPPWQSPNWDTQAGVFNEDFEKSRLLEI